MTTTVVTTIEPTTTIPRHERVVPIAGLLSVAALVGAFVALPADPGGTAAADIANRYAEGSDAYLRATVFEVASVALLLVLLAGLCLHLRRTPGGELAASLVALGGAVVASCQLVSYGLIATLAHGTAVRGDDGVVMAFYDASALAFVTSNVGLCLVCLATGLAVLTGSGRRRVLGGVSLVVGLAAAVGSLAFAMDGLMSPHGDLSFLGLLLQLVWTVAASVSLLRRS